MASQPQTATWLAENGPKKLEALFRAVICQPYASILIADDNRRYCDVSSGACKLLGRHRENIVGHQIDDFTPAGFKPVLQQHWQTFLAESQQVGTLPLLRVNGDFEDVDYSARANVLPSRHLFALREASGNTPDSSVKTEKMPPGERVAPWVRDYAMFLLDTRGKVAAWYGGAERIYGYRAGEMVGLDYARCYPTDEILQHTQQELKRSTGEGHIGTERWHVKKDGSRFWANSITVALKDGNGDVQGFAKIVRDFSARHERDEALRKDRAAARPAVARSAVAGIASGEFDRILEANDAFLEMVGYSREDLLAGTLDWTDLTPTEYALFDELAHEESLRFGASTPFEKEFLRKDSSRVPVLIATAVLGISPFRWIAFVQDLSERDQRENIAGNIIESRHDFEEMVGSSAALKRTLSLVEVVAPTDATVLILGETGTGKELVARAIHRMSPRKHWPFITLNCAAIPTGLLESELFGYERGAFTGALSQKIGRFEMAHRGTLFLDEVGDIPLDLQPKLLRALQEKSFERLGGTKTIPIDVRLVAATNRNLTQMMGDKLFRSDLYYRLKVFPITTPPLRDRPEDIPILARHFTKKYAAKMERQIEKIASQTMKALVNWQWPGNVRELENFIERSVILSTGSDLRAPIDELMLEPSQSGASSTLDQVERDHILRILRETNGVVTTAATRLGLHRTTLNAMMRKLGISRKDI